MTTVFAGWILCCVLGAQEESRTDSETDDAWAELTVERLATGMGFVEGPVWLPEEEALVFSDIPRDKLMRWSEVDGLTEFEDRPHPNGNILDREGRLITCQHGSRTLVRREKDGTLSTLAERIDGKRLNSPNDVAVGLDGSLWFTDPPWGLPNQREGRELPGHWVFHLDPVSGQLRVLLKDHAMPNGIALSPDGRHLYVSDTGGHPAHPDASLRDRAATVTAYVVVATDEGPALGPKPAWQVDARSDGMCVDMKGRLYCTGRDAVTIWSDRGESLGAIAVPEGPANVCFGGPDRRTLFITARTSLYAVQEMPTAGWTAAAATQRASDGDRSPR